MVPQKIRTEAKLEPVKAEKPEPDTPKVCLASKGVLGGGVADTPCSPPPVKKKRTRGPKGTFDKKGYQRDLMRTRRKDKWRAHEPV